MVPYERDSMIGEDERRRAARIHYSFLPEDYSDGDLHIAVNCVPWGDIGGDYGSILPLCDGRVVVCLCDAVGHDVGSALYAARINTFVLAHAPRAGHPCELVDELNAFLCRSLAGIGIYASFFVAFLDVRHGTLDYAGAGHPPAIHYRRASGNTETLASESTLLGVSHPAPLACSAARRSLDPGDKLFFYTDGIIEHRDGQGRAFGMERLEQFVIRHNTLPSPDFNRRLMETLTRFGPGPPRDDMLMMTASLQDPSGRQAAALRRLSR
ncbi:MAG: PP2C family protein-serine/threonine phosphatase [Gammaproteobacteria bacterium]|nr:PP2C family protein-serine/threonine phosphatase [Gammaproteobacteria bacterium]